MSDGTFRLMASQVVREMEAELAAKNAENERLREALGIVARGPLFQELMEPWIRRMMEKASAALGPTAQTPPE